jgi:transposase InsO family protein
VRQAEADQGLRPDLPSSEEREEIKQLKRENAELRRALGRAGETVGGDRVARLMRSDDLRGAKRRRQLPATLPKRGARSNRSGARGVSRFGSASTPDTAGVGARRFPLRIGVDAGHSRRSLGTRVRLTTAVDRAGPSRR